MGVYIDMEMPKGRPVCIVIDAAGQARRYDLNNDRYADDKLFEAVPIPPHGRLIDEKYIVPKDGYIIADGMACIPVKDIVNAPTIIPASKEGET